MEEEGNGGEEGHVLEISEVLIFKQGAEKKAQILQVHQFGRLLVGPFVSIGAILTYRHSFV